LVPSKPPHDVTSEVFTAVVDEEIPRVFVPSFTVVYR